MPTPEKSHPSQHIGGTILVVMMEVDPAHEDEFNRWYDDEHLPERLEIPGTSAPVGSSSREAKVSSNTCASGNWRMGARSTATPIRPNSNGRVSFATAFTPTSSSVCVGCTRRFIPRWERLKITLASIRSSPSKRCQHVVPAHGSWWRRSRV